MSKLIAEPNCPHCGLELPQAKPRSCPRCAGSLQQRYLRAGCLSSAPKLWLFAAALWFALRAFA